MCQCVGMCASVHNVRVWLRVWKSEDNFWQFLLSVLCENELRLSYLRGKYLTHWAISLVQKLTFAVLIPELFVAIQPFLIDSIQSNYK